MLIIDFINIKFILIVLSPIIFCILYTIDLMQILGLHNNIINYMAIPIILGISIYNNMTLIHRYKFEKNINIVYRSTGKSIIIGAQICIVIFSWFWFINFRGLGELGLTLLIGMCISFITTLILLPLITGINKDSDS